MRFRVSPDISGDHAEIRRLVILAFDGVECADVELLVERSRGPGESFTGRAYAEPRSRHLRPGTRFLVRLRIPATLRNRAYPKTYRYVDRKTAPWITVGDWQERLVALAAHEACHIRQFREGLRRSEVEAERWAAARLEAWRRQRAVPGEVVQLSLWATSA